MGILRIYLALCVVAGHSSSVFPWQMHNGREAVQIFFIISGFYMALVYKKYSNCYEFYVSRFLRIFIPYWTVAFGIILGYLVMGVLFNNYMLLGLYRNALEINGFAGVLYTSLTNIFLFGQDTVMFLAHDKGEAFSITLSFSSSQSPLWKYLIIPQSWSIGVELLFYLSVPFLVRLNTKKVSVLLICSLLLRVAWYELSGLYNDPWNCRFFPFELALFLLGMITCRIYMIYEVKIGRCLKYIFQRKTNFYFLQFPLSLFFFWLASGLTPFVGKYISVKYSELASYFVWASLIPLFFHLSRKDKMDRFLGELSYPVYLVHCFIITSLSVVDSKIDLGFENDFYGVIAAISSVIISVCLVWTIINPLDRIRHNRAKWIADKMMNLTFYRWRG